MTDCSPVDLPGSQQSSSPSSSVSCSVSRVFDITEPSINYLKELEEEGLHKIPSVHSINVKELRPDSINDLIKAQRPVRTPSKHQRKLQADQGQEDPLEKETREADSREEERGTAPFEENQREYQRSQKSIGRKASWNSEGSAVVEAGKPMESLSLESFEVEKKYTEIMDVLWDIKEEKENLRDLGRIKFFLDFKFAE